MLDFCIYLLYRAGSFLIGLLPLPFVFVLGELSGAAACMVLPKYRRLAFHNLQIAFGNEKSAREMHRLVRQHFRRLGANLLSGVKLGRMPMEKIVRRIDVENVDEVHRS